MNELTSWQLQTAVAQRGREHAKQIKARRAMQIREQQIKALALREQARWMAINPMWAQYGPELQLTSRGTAFAKVRGSLGQTEAAFLAAGIGGLVVGAAVTFGMTYLACRMAMKRR